MRTLRQLSYAGTTTLLTSLGALTMGCSGADLGMMDGTNGGTGSGATGTGGTGGPGTGASGGGGGLGTGGEGPMTDPSVCIPGIPTTSQVPRLLNREYDNIVADLLDVTEINGQKPSAGLLTDSTGAMDAYMWKAYQTVAEDVAGAVVGTEKQAKFMECDPVAEGAACYDATIRNFGRKIFRRPLEEDEVTRFMGLTSIMPQGTPEEITEAILYAFLVSPSFILVPELKGDPGAQPGSFALTSHETAMRLSLTLWGSVPDDALNQAADDGLLASREQILAEAQRMMQDQGRAGRQIAAATRAYLKMDTTDGHWWKPEQDQTIFPDYSPAAKPALAAEIDAIAEDVAFSGGSFKELFTTNVGFVNQDSAALYGLNPADYGPELEKVTFEPADSRPGILTRAGFLSSFSNADATSPILRGAFVTVNVLGVDPGAPDPTVANTPIPPGTYATRREQIEALTEPPACAKCHGEFVNPPGFVLEQYNAVGQIQTTDALGGAIDSTAVVNISTDNVKTLSTPMELMTEIANNPKSQRMYVERLVAFATGRLPNSQDACLVDTIDGKLSTDGYTLLNLFTDLTQADSFSLRTVGN